MTGRHSEAEYERRINREVPLYRERQRDRVQCLESVEDLVSRSLEAHHHTQHGRGGGPKWDNTPPPYDPRLYRISLRKSAWLVGCPVKDCRGRANNIINLQIHFVHCHMQETIVILE